MKIWRARQKTMIKLNGVHATSFKTVPYYWRVVDTSIPMSRVTLQYEVGDESDEDAAKLGILLWCFDWLSLSLVAYCPFPLSLWFVGSGVGWVWLTVHNFVNYYIGPSFYDW